VHAQKADRRGNVLMWGIIGVQREAVLAARRAIVTVEEIVDSLDAPPNAAILPSRVIAAICPAPGGAFPSYAQGYYSRNNPFYKRWDAISRERDRFQAWIDRHIMSTKNFDEFRRTLEQTTSHV
jgi:glutaconate CoA-transferase, subunit A